MASRFRAEVELAERANLVEHWWGLLALVQRIRPLDFEASQPVPLGTRLAVVVADH